MAKMWEGRTKGETSRAADEFNSSISVDKRLWRQDITGSMVHARMLARQRIISKSEADTICEALAKIISDIESGELVIDETCEDIHMFVEQVLTERVGDTGKKVHTARSRNDQVSLDLRMYLRSEISEISLGLKGLIKTLCDIADDNKETIMPGYTHLQRAQPVSFGFHMMAYAMMFLRDVARLTDCKKRTNISTIGACALAGTTYNTDRAFEAEELGFHRISMNAMDSVSDRDFCIELLSDISIIMMHLSRFCEEIILWSSWEFKFIELSDAFTTGSSIMPQKKNPDMAELIRGKCGRVYGDLFALLTIMKGIPLAYNKDMQEDKEQVFDACDSVRSCLDIFTQMLLTMKPVPENMLRAAKEGFINATDAADYLVTKGLPFRSAYKISGQIVAYCLENKKTLESLSLKEYRNFSELFGKDIYDAVDLNACMQRRSSEGGTGSDSVTKQITHVRNKLKEFEN